MPPITGAFRPTTLAHLRALASQKAAIDAEAAKIVAVAVEAAGVDLPAAVEWDVAGEANHWRVAAPEESPP